ncbi:hypothetical protein [Parachitinimonas caeni]|uniref:Uncharacterized protein n=1 Tax=Parachitinimonas caeni TaxID=3031301 RepID=A0ABT7DXZ0_9NEIS|nr:hypothetical protein [Parachitinimonas caeni]MDK2124936.1 hypothetical protein [Parachitinimonas caeni]
MRTLLQHDNASYSSLNNARPTLVELAEDMLDNLLDQVFNGGEKSLRSPLSKLQQLSPAIERLPAGTGPSRQLLQLMAALEHEEAVNGGWYSADARDLVCDVVDEMERLLN